MSHHKSKYQTELIKLKDFANKMWRRKKFTICNVWKVKIQYIERGGGLEKCRDEGTLKTPIPSCRLHWSFCLGWWSNFVGSESGQKQSVNLLQNMVHSTFQHPPSPPPTVTHCLYTVLYIGKGGGGRRSERRYIRGATVHKYHIVPSSMGATVQKLGRKYKPWVNVSPVYKIC